MVCLLKLSGLGSPGHFFGFGESSVVFWAFLSVSSGFHPQTNGQSERVNKEAETINQLLCEEEPTKWSYNLPWVEHALNHSLSQVYPCFFYHLQSPDPSVQHSGKAAEVPSTHTVAHRCQRFWRRARMTLIKMSTVYSRSDN